MHSTSARSFCCLQIALLSICLPHSLRGALIAYDGAVYAPTTSISGISGGSGWSTGWSGVNNVVAGSLTINGVATNGNRFVTDGNNNGSARVIATNGFEALLQNGRFGKEGTTLWLSFLFRAVTTSANNYAGLTLYDGPVSTANQVLYLGVPTGGSTLGIFATTNSAPPFGASSSSTVVGTNQQTLFLVAKLMFGTPNGDRVFLYVNPPLDFEPTNNHAAVVNFMAYQFDRLLFASGATTTTAAFDEIRLGETFADVAPLDPNRLAYSQLRRQGNTNQMAASPLGGVVEANDVLYGTSLYGGVAGVGTVFRMNKDGSDYQVIWNFLQDTNGNHPNGVIVGSDGALYGTCGNQISGANSSVFKLNTDGSGFAVLRKFGGSLDGFQPTAPLIEGSDGVLYGTTQSGGSNNLGTVFKVNKNGTGYQVIKRFAASERGTPQGPVMEGADGALYGTTSGSQGSVFKLNKDGSGFTVIHNFSPGPGDGGIPQCGLLQANDHLLYGMTFLGGTNGWGTMYRLDTNGANFTLIGSSPGGNPRYAGLIEGPDGKLYGVVEGARVFRVNKDGTELTTLHTFANAYGDGRAAVATLFLATDGALYGTTAGGGGFGNQAVPPLGQGGEGTVFKVRPDGSEYAVVRSFTSTGGDAAVPAGIIRASDGALYAAMNEGGTYGVGAICKINRDGSGYTILKSFENFGGDGQFPAAPLLEGSDGKLYGTTSNGGDQSVGTVFRINKDGSGYERLRSFLATTERNPLAALIEGQDGALYGTTFNATTVFKMNKDGSGYQVLKTFTFGGADGYSTTAPLLQASNGVLYGVTTAGGANNRGTLFRLNPDGGGFQVLKSFSTVAGDVSSVTSGLIEGSDGALYGAAQSTATSTASTVFKINTNGTGLTILWQIPGDPDEPLLEWDGMLYGTSAGNLGNDSGWVFRLNRDGSNFETLYKFRGTDNDGQIPAGGLTRGADGALYGVTSGGGYTQGTIYRLGPPMAAANPPVTLAATLLSNSNTFQLTFTGTPLAQYDIEATYQLPSGWQTVTTVQATVNGLVQYLENIPAGTASRFFRAVGQ